MKTIVLATLLLFCELFITGQNRPKFTILSLIGDTSYIERDGSIKIYPHMITVRDETIDKTYYLTRMRDTSYCAVTDTIKKDYHFVARYEVLVTLDKVPESARFFLTKDLGDDVTWSAYLYKNMNDSDGSNKRLFLYDVVDDSTARVMNLKEPFLETFK